MKSGRLSNARSRMTLRRSGEGGDARRDAGFLRRFRRLSRPDAGQLGMNGIGSRRFDEEFPEDLSVRVRRGARRPRASRCPREEKAPRRESGAPFVVTDGRVCSRPRGEYSPERRKAVRYSRGAETEACPARSGAGSVARACARQPGIPSSVAAMPLDQDARAGLGRAASFVFRPSPTRAAFTLGCVAAPRRASAPVESNGDARSAWPDRRDTRLFRQTSPSRPTGEPPLAPEAPRGRATTAKPRFPAPLRRAGAGAYGKPLYRPPTAARRSHASRETRGAPTRPRRSSGGRPRRRILRFCPAPPRQIRADGTRKRGGVQREPR